MENDERARSFRMPLLEIVIVVGIFAIVSVLLVKLFLSADQLQAASVNVSKAVIQAEAAAEIIKNSISIEDATASLNLTKEQNQEAYVAYFDRQWKPVSSKGAYTLQVAFSKEERQAGYMLIAKIKIIDQKDNELCILPVKHYVLTRDER